MTFLIAGLGLLLAERKSSEFGPYTSRGSFRLLLKEAFHLLWRVLFLLISFSLVEKVVNPYFQLTEWQPLFYGLAAFGLTFLKKEGAGKRAAEPGDIVLFLCIFILCLFVSDPGRSLPIIGKIAMATRLVIGIQMFEIMIIGIKNKLLFSNVPVFLEGLPKAFWVAALLSLAFSGLEGILLYE